MEAALQTMIKDALADFVVRGLDEVNTSSFPVVLRDMELNARRLNHEFDPKGEQVISITSGKIGTLKVNPGWMGSIDVVASDIHLSFSFSAVQAMRNGVRQAMRSSEDDALAAAIKASLEEEQQDQQQRQQHQQQQQHTSRQRPLPARLAPEPLQAQETKPQHRQQQVQTKPVAHDQHRQSEYPQQPVELATSSPCPQYCVAHGSSLKRTKVDFISNYECSHCHITVRSNLKDLKYCQGCSCELLKCMICGDKVQQRGEEIVKINGVLRDTLKKSLPHASGCSGLWHDIQEAFDNRSNGILDKFFSSGASQASSDGSPAYLESVFPRVYARAGA